MVPKFISKHIIIGGLPRSGTSFVRALIGSHPDIAIYKWELPFWTQIYPKFGNRKLTKKRQNGLLDELLASYTIVKSDVIFIRSEIEQYLKDCECPPSAIDVYQFLMGRYLEAKKKKIFGVKTPFNENWAHGIFDNFPNTKFVHVVRNPIDVARSLKLAKEKWWGGHMNYFRHIYQWNRSVKLAKLNSSKRPKQYMVLKYENLVANPFQTTRDICGFLEVDFDESMLKMKGQSGWKGRNSSVESKKNVSLDDGDLNEEIVARYEILCGKLMKEMGYMKASDSIERDYLLRLRFEIWSYFYHIYLFMTLTLKRFLVSIRPSHL